MPRQSRRTLNAIDLISKTLVVSTQTGRIYRAFKRYVPTDPNQPSLTNA